ncbi:alpha/beta fold hydrolase [Umezawaea tangerina]|uniref:Pimeloyl-ACP methyl ester carboxylesterase n=1 Tax=Umezawaea tangerina TaxID=84725 RepID=A0A2T0SMZ5_9PSEU|nr:alpha/beta fold hydrolase [Umezawaea tangerina]PRY34791.1 pimeloyl-ACP methyl ester carboxylesterase [Umezawaea tangerina]
MTTVYRSEAGGRTVREQYRALLEHWPVEAERRTVPTRAGDTFVVVSGPVDAPPVVALHGSGGNSATWLADIATWAPHLRVHAVDVIGEPGLSAPARPPLGSPEYAEWLDDVLDGLGLTSAAVVGMSLGGWLALDYASRRPERVTGLVLLGPSGIGRRKVGWLLRALPFFALGQWGRRRIVRIVAGADVGEYREVVASTFRHFKPRVEFPVFDDAVLRGLEMPMLVVVGGRDAMLDSRGTARRLAATAPHADVRVLPAAGHFIPGQADAVLDFLR